MLPGRLSVFISPPASYILIGISVFFLTGIALLAWIRPKGNDPLEFLALASGLSLSITALFGVLLFQTSRTVEKPFAIFLYLLCLLIIALGVTYHLLRDLVFRPAERKPRKFPFFSILLAIFGIAVIAALALLRFHQAEGLVVGPWVDSLSHTFWVQKMVSTGGVPRYLLPELPGAFAPFITFDITAALFTAPAGIPAANGVLWMSLMVSTLIPLSLYRLGKVLWGDWKSAALTALLSGFVFTFPAFLLAWGRSTTLTLCVLFPLLAAEIIRLRQLPYRKREYWKSFAIILILSAGVFLSDPFGFPLTILFLAAFYLAGIIPSSTPRDRSALDSYPLAAVALAYITVLPYLRWVRENTFVPPGHSMMEGLQPLANLTFLVASPRDAVLVALAVFGLIMLIIEHRSHELVMLTLLMVLFSLPTISTRFIPAEELRLMISLPAALLAGFFLVDTAAIIARWSHPAVAYGILLLETAGFLLWGLLAGPDLFPPSVILVDQADMQALNWIRENTSSDSRFFNQPVPWQTGIYRGVDGGYWILNETGRGQLVPPAVYPSGGESYQTRINSWARTALTLTTCDEDFWNLMNEARLEYIYLKEGTGIFSTEDFIDCEGLLKVYDADGITLFQSTNR